MVKKPNIPKSNQKTSKKFYPVSYTEEPSDIHAQKERELKKLKADQDELAGLTQQLKQYRSDPGILLTQRETVSALEQRASDITNRYGSQSALDKRVTELTEKVSDPKLKYLNSPDYRSQYQRLLDLGAGGQPVQNNFKEMGLEYLTPEERGAYNYHYYKHGKDKADEYLSGLQWNLNSRRAAEIVKDTTMEDAPILSDLLKLKQGYDSGIDTWQQSMRHSGDMLHGNDRYVVPTAQQIASTQIRQQMADKGLASQMAYDVATSLGEMTPSLFTTAILSSTGTALAGAGSKAAGAALIKIGKTLGTGMMGLSSAGGAYQDALNRGYTPDQARGYGILTGASEVGLEYLLDGITKLGGKATAPLLEKLSVKVKNVLARVADTYGGKILSEFSEEYLQSVLTPVYQNLTLGTGQDVDLLSEDALYEACIGAISSGFVEGGAQLGGNVTSAEVTSNRKPGGIRFTLKDVEIPTWEQLSQKPAIPVVDISKPQTTGRFSDRRKTIKDNLASIIAKPYYNSDTGTFIFLTEKSYSHTFSGKGKLQINAAEHLPELIENAVLTHTEPRDHGNEYAANVYTFFAAAKSDAIHPVKIKIKEYDYIDQELPRNIKDFFGKMPRDYSAAYDAKVLYVDTIEEDPSGSANDTIQKNYTLNPDGSPLKSIAKERGNVNEAQTVAAEVIKEGLSSSVKDGTNDSIALNPDRPSKISVTDLLGVVNADYQKYVPQLKDASGLPAAPTGKRKRINIVNQIPEEEEEAQHRYTRWIQETEVAKGMYGDFDLQAELQNPRFRHLLRSGISVPDAYLAAHREEILINAVRAGLRRGEENVNRRVEENRRRPRENGLDPGAAFITRPNPAKMTKADRQAIARRAAGGERITF